MAQSAQGPIGGRAGQQVVKLPEYPDFLPTVHVPIITEDQRELLRTIHELPIMLAVSILEGRVTSSFHPEINTPENAWYTAMTMKLYAGKDLVRMLTHSIPRDYICAMVMGTIGWRIHPERANTPEALQVSPYNSNGPGTYIATMSITHRHGKGLFGNEYKMLADKVALYLKAYDASLIPDNQRTKDMEDALRWAYHVDFYYAAKMVKRGKTAFINAFDAYEKVSSLEKRFRELYTSTTHLDPDAHLVQGMSYVGCATRDIDDISSAHLQDHKFQGSNYTWWLTMSCIRDIGLWPSVHIVHAIRTWEPEQLPISEVLVTMLARSMVEEFGFNVASPGGITDSLASSPRDWDGDLYDVMHYRTYLPDQLDESSRGLDELSNKIITVERESKRLTNLWIDTAIRATKPRKPLPTLAELEELAKAIKQRGEIVDAIGQVDKDLQTCVDFFSLLQEVLKEALRGNYLHILDALLPPTQGRCHFRREEENTEDESAEYESDDEDDSKGVAFADYDSSTSNSQS
ncbi:hypothetical protein GQX73_g10825 [Xylaria multiplex]|uniref:Uncharacterized protein n=1 Tax=Xylaria multiplex TaxID=323545 RepID=A0A7C8ML21_9PEZI|nr:hypothetical protein GQX73_g10825 [Xylaria multiplex]